MTVYLRRQFAASCADGEEQSLPSVTQFPFRVFDVLPRNALIIEDGQWSQNAISVAATESYTIPLPQNYDSATQKLYVTLRSTARCKVVVTTTSETNTFLLKATNGSTEGDHKGVVMIQDNISSIVVSVPTAFDTALIDYCLWVIPDLTTPDSYRNGNLVFGYVVS